MVRLRDGSFRGTRGRTGLGAVQKLMKRSGMLSRLYRAGMISVTLVAM